MSVRDAAVASRDEVVRARHVEAKQRALPDHLERISWSAERLAEERRRRLRALLRLAKQRSSWHRRRLREIDPDRFTEQELALLPAMHKHELMSHFDEIVTDPRLSLATAEQHLTTLGERPGYLLDRYQAICSSGSTGTRSVTVYGWDAWVSCYLGWFRYLLRAFAGERFSTANVAAGKAFHISSALVQTFTDPEIGGSHPVPVTWPLEQIIQTLNQLRPDVVGTYPSMLPLLTEAAKQGRLQIRPRYLVSGGEPLLPEIRTAAEHTFAAPVLNWWLCSEGGPLAIDCGHGHGLHLSDDLLIVEPVDTAGQPVATGQEAAKIYLTNLYNPVLPLIRYEISDQVKLLPGDCPCGSKHRLVADIHGRLDDTFTYPGGITVHPHLFRSALASDPHILEYQVRQTCNGASILIRGDNANTNRIRSQLLDDLTHLNLTNPHISIQTVDQLDRQETGKLQRFIPAQLGTTRGGWGSVCSSSVKLTGRWRRGRR